MTDKLFNKEVKMAYIDSYFAEENTRNTLLFTFVKSAELERQYNKDLYAFYDDEIASLLSFLKRDNINSLNRDMSFFKDYVNWCILTGKRGIYENGENRMEIFQITEDMSKYVSTRKIRSKFLSKEELDELIKCLKNPIDQALVLSIYEQIGGEQLNELRSMKISDIDKSKNQVRLTDLDGTIRESSISLKLVNLLKETNDRKTYIYNNGFTDNMKEVELTDSPYIFKMVYRKKQVGEMVNYAGLINKLNNIKKFTGYNLITVNSIKETRILHEISDVKKGMGLNVANNETYRIAFDNLRKLYNIGFSETQLYNLKRKYEHVVKLKEL